MSLAPRRADRAVVSAPGDRRLHARASDRAPPRHPGHDRGGARSAARWRWRGRDRAPQARRSQDAGAVDALWLGAAQACALIPGVSRNGATLAAARLRRFTREDANRLARHVALPVIAGATLLKSVRLIRRGLPPRSAVPIAVGTAASFASTLGSTWLIRQVERDRSLLPYAVYRVALASIVLRRLGHRPPAGAIRPMYDNDVVTDAYAAAGVDTRQADHGVGGPRRRCSVRSTPVVRACRCRSPGTTPACCGSRPGSGSPWPPTASDPR